MIRRILVVELLGGLGDVVIALPAVHALAWAHPDAELTVATTAAGAALLAADPAVTATWSVATDDVRDGVSRALAAVGPDLVVSTTRHSGLPELLARDADERGTRVVTDLWRGPPPDQPIGERFVELLHRDGLVDDLWVDATLVGTADGARALTEAAPGADPPVVLVPDAGMAVKQWPAARWAGIAATLRRRGRTVVAVTGPDGGPSVPGVTEPPRATVLPVLSVPALAGAFAAVAARGGVVVGPDTGPMRIAAAAGATTVGVFGPTAAARYGLATDRGVDLQGFPACPVRRPTSITEQRCWWSARCPFSTSGPLCLEELGVGDVAVAVTASL